MRLPRPLATAAVSLAPLLVFLTATTASAQDASPAATTSATPDPSAPALPAGATKESATGAGAGAVAEPKTPEPGTASSTPGGTATPIPSQPRDARPAQATEGTGRFEFGSYGRISVASDGRGGTGRPADIVAYGSRVDEASYTEFELRREDTFKEGIKTRIVTTLALFPPFFHFSGQPLQAIGLRNLYVQGSYDRLQLWAGSRMYRGDDIYLLNWWPLDNQNTVGGGAILNLPSDTTIALHAGMQRLDNLNQFQTIPSVAPYGFGAVPVTFLDRPRTIETLKVTQFFRNNAEKKYWSSDREGFKAILYGEAHQISAGVRRETDPTYDRPLPSDSGFLIGTQLAYWTGQRDTYVSLFLRHARGLAAYDPLATPVTFANDRSTSGTTETLAALAGNYETEHFGLLAATYVRFFRDGGTAPTSREKYDEGIVIARPQIFLGEHFGVGIEGSYQQRRYALVDPGTSDNVTASLLRGAILPYFSPSGRGSFKRPQIGLVYAITSRDGGSRSLYAKEDVFSQRSTEHFAGILAEWWFNFSSYP